MSGRKRGSDQSATTGRETTAAERASATRLITRIARDPDDREQLLDALGLTTEQGQTPTT